MAKEHAVQCTTHMPEGHKMVVVHVKLTEHERNALKAILSLEGSTMQAYFAAKAMEKIASASRHP